MNKLIKPYIIAATSRGWHVIINKPLLLLLTLVVFTGNIFAAVKLPTLFNDGMVLQRTKKIPVWGWANPGETVTVVFNHKTYQTKTNADSTWSLKMKAMDAGGPYNMKVSGTDNNITIKDILIGDVFICSGQSNMEFTVAVAKDKYPQEIAAATNPNIRQFLVVNQLSFTAVKDVRSVAGWKAADPQTVLKFTAVGYFFAKALYEKYHVPIGLIHSSWGGTPIQSWMGEQAFTGFPEYKKQVDNLKNHIQDIKAKEAAMVATWNQQALALEKSFNVADAFSPNSGEAEWKTITLPGTWQSVIPKNGNVSWFKKEINVSAADAGKQAVLLLGSVIEEDSTYINGRKIGSTGDKYHERKYDIPAGLLKAGANMLSVRVVSNYGPGGFVVDNRTYQVVLPHQTIDLRGNWLYHEVASLPAQASRPTIFQSQPTALYNAMIAPLTPYAVRGILWYQGEANTWKASEYRALFPAMITDWRRQWNDPELPFLFVQLANFGPLKDQPAESPWAELREAQTMALSLPKTGMAVTHDIGEYKNIHPLNKGDVGKRLALAAEKVIYNEDIVYSGPIYQGMKVDGNKIIISFTNLGGGLVTKNGEPVKYISIAGADKKFVWASAKIKGGHLVVWNDAISSPVAVRYAWAESPDGSNLYNKEGLPVSSFRTDSEPVVAAKN